jgi:hypothetical protein
MKKIILILALINLNIFFLKKIESFLLDWNFTWTLAKSIPYISLLIFGFLLMRLTKKIIPFKIQAVNKIIMFVIFIIPFSIGFAINPIYEGDFSKNGRTIVLNSNYSDLKRSDFIVLSIPNCPFCHESISHINLIQKRNPKLRIKFIILSKEIKELKPYSEELNKEIKVSLVKDLDEMLEFSAGKFPTFLFKSEKKLWFWSNKEFGTRAKDFIEKIQGDKLIMG